MDTGVNCVVGGNDDVLWVEAFKIVPEKPPRADYPDYAVGFVYEHIGEDIELCQRGFHASPTFRHCAEYIEPELNCRFLRVKVYSPKWDDSYAKCVSNTIEICQEYTYDEVLDMKCVFIKNGFEYRTKGFKFHCQDKDENGYTLPAYIGVDGSKYWYTDDKWSRWDKDENGYTLPAVIRADGSKFWYRNGTEFSPTGVDINPKPRAAPSWTKIRI